MSLAKFISSLFESGAVEVPLIAPWDEADVQAAREAIVAGELIYRDSLTAGTPMLDAEAALWGARQLYRAAQCLVFRGYDTSAAKRELSSKPAGEINASVHYSVDLTMRFLPDLSRHASALPKDDSLTIMLQAWASEWPLSSVGIELHQPPSDSRLESVVSDRALLTLYLDRVVARGDIGRLNHPLVREAVRAAIGMHPELAPDVHAALPTDEIPGPIDDPNVSQGETP